MYIDEGGLGAGVVDLLIEKFKNRVVGIDNAKKAISGKKENKIMKHDTYSNLLAMMEQDKCSFLNDKEVLFSMNGINYDFDSKGKMLISGRRDHICEAMVRAFWGKTNQKKRLFLL